MPMMTHVTTESIPVPAFLGPGTWELRNLSPITVLFGKNGSGKSLLLRQWRDKSEDDNTHSVTPERTGEMDFQPQYIQQGYSGTARKQYANRNFSPDYRRRIIGRLQTYLSTRGNYRGQDVAPGSPTDLESLINSLVTDFTLEIGGTTNAPYKLTRLNEEKHIAKVDELSSGEAQLVTIGLDILTIAAIWELERRERRILLIDEPDVHIHPDLQVRFADFILRVASAYDLQVAIATHSTALLAALGQFGGDDTRVIYLRRDVFAYEAQRFGSIQKELASCLGGHVLMGPYSAFRF